MTTVVIHRRGRASKHLDTPVVLQPGGRSSFSSISPLGFQRSPLIVPVIEDWHSSMRCQAVKNKSNWLPFSVMGWLIAMACLAATPMRHAGPATCVQWCSSALHLLQWLYGVSHGYLWCKHKQKGVSFLSRRDSCLHLRVGWKRKEEGKGITNQIGKCMFFNGQYLMFMELGRGWLTLYTSC